MHTHIRRASMLAISAGAMLALHACQRERSRETVGAVDTATGRQGMTDTGGMPGAMPPSDTMGGAGVSGNLTDANIVALLDEANKADSAAGAFAYPKAKNAEVKSFAKLMMGEHHALRVQGQQLARQLKVAPQLPSEDPLPAAAADEMSALRSVRSGAQFDSTYIAKEIGVHRAVLDLVDKAHGAAQNAQLKELITKARPVIQKHLDRAEEIQARLGKSS